VSNGEISNKVVGLTHWHGMADNHPLYATWSAMRQRCNNPNSTHYRHYGGRGITICARWDDFELFIADVGDKPSKRHSLDRIDVNGDYKPGNVRWATQKEQRWNTRPEFAPGQTAFGRTQTLDEWAREFGIKRGTLGRRLHDGWPLEQALTKPARRYVLRDQS
jgi:hypothetical protein